MQYGWARAALLAAGISLAACGAVYGEPGGGGGASAESPSAGSMKAFLERNAKADGVVVRPSGLQYRVVTSGPEGGAHPAMGDEVKVNYEGALIDGTVFDSSYQRGSPAVFTVGQLVPGFDEALMLMKPGDTWYIYLPPELGYGDRPAGQIPPGSVLVFKLEIIGLLPKGGVENRG